MCVVCAGVCYVMSGSFCFVVFVVVGLFVVLSLCRWCCCVIVLLYCFGLCVVGFCCFDV